MVALLNWGVCLFSASLLTKSCLLCFWNWRVSCSLVASDSLYHIIRFPSGYGEWLKGHQSLSRCQMTRCRCCHRAAVPADVAAKHWLRQWRTMCHHHCLLTTGARVVVVSSWVVTPKAWNVKLPYFHRMIRIHRQWRIRQRRRRSIRQRSIFLGRQPTVLTI